MATRNRTQLFIQYRNAAITPSRHDYGVEMRGRPPFWIRLCEEVREDMKSIEQKLHKLEKLNRQPTGFDDEREAEHELGILADEITDMFRQCKDCVYEIGHPPKGTYESPDETKSRQNAQLSLATSLHDLFQKFRQDQASHLQKLKGVENRNKGAFAINQYFEQGDDDDDDHYDPGFNNEQMRILTTAEHLAEEREKEIAQISQSINDLMTIFKDMHILLLEQDTVLDRIDYNIERVVTYTGDANQELIVADESHKDYRKKLCILFLIVVVITLIMVLVATTSVIGDATPPGNKTQ